MTEIAPTREVGSVTIVTLRGRIELGEGTAILRDTVKDLLERGRLRIVLNLSEATSMDSAGIAELISAFVALKNRGGELKLLKPAKKVLDMLEITGLRKVLDVQFDEDAFRPSF